MSAERIEYKVVDAADSTSSLVLSCGRCGRSLTPGRGELYVVRVEAVADPFPPRFTDDDLATDPREQIDRLLRELRHLSPEEAMNQVYRRKSFYLCNACYQAWIENPTG